MIGNLLPNMRFQQRYQFKVLGARYLKASRSLSIIMWLVIIEQFHHSKAHYFLVALQLN